MRGVKSVLLAFFVLCLLSFAAAGTAAELELLQGDVPKGEVEVVDRDGVRFAAIDEMLGRLGLVATVESGAIQATYSGKKIEFWSGSNVARINGQVFTLQAPVIKEGENWWGEAASTLAAINQFLTTAGRPAGLRWATKTSASAPTTNTPVAPPLTTRAASPKTSSDAPRLSQVRWGEQVDAYRAVVDISQQVDVSVREYPNRYEVTFPKTTASEIGGKSPWESLSAVSRQTDGNTVLTFRHTSPKVKSFWVLDPPRYVIDFYFGGANTEQPLQQPTGSVQPTPESQNPKPESQPDRVNTGAKKRYTVVVDAGHGGHDPGAVGNGLKEKDINLKAAHEFAASLKNLGMEVKMTRADDRYLKLGERTEFANSCDADIFISLHCNALPKGKHASGIELYLMAESTDKDALNLAILENRELSGNAQNAEEVNAAADKRTKLLLHILGDMQQNDKINESTALAEDLYNKMRATGLSIRKVRQAPFFVLKGAAMPALLVEMGYITEKSDATQLNSAAYRKKMMDSMAQGIQSYLNRARQEGGR